MIEKMIMQVKRYLPLKISEVMWDGTIFQVYGLTWNFSTLSAWRISTDSKVSFGCFDEDSFSLINDLKNTEIIDIDFQSDKLKIDPVFILSNRQRIEIFSTDTFEPWTFTLNELGAFIATPSEPNVFDQSLND